MTKQIRKYERKKRRGRTKERKKKRAVCLCLGVVAVLVWRRGQLHWIRLILAPVNKQLPGTEGQGVLSAGPVSTGGHCAAL